MNQKINLDEILSRLKNCYSFSTDKQLADWLGISGSDLLLRKKRGTIIYLLIDAAINHNINLQWLIYGESSNKIKVTDELLFLSDEKLMEAVIIGIEERIMMKDIKTTPIKKAREIIEIYKKIRTDIISSKNSNVVPLKESEFKDQAERTYDLIKKLA
jgi:hypothetical protein